MKIGLVRAELFQADGQTDRRTDEQTDRHDEANSHFRNIANALKKEGLTAVLQFLLVGLQNSVTDITKCAYA
jgi:2,4-dienoyl-CoA reductase-like NADH-dependent reductase (Old Yellow Enzyme family)